MIQQKMKSQDQVLDKPRPKPFTRVVVAFVLALVWTVLGLYGSLVFVLLQQRPNNKADGFGWLVLSHTLPSLAFIYLRVRTKLLERREFYPAVLILAPSPALLLWVAAPNDWLFGFLLAAMNLVWIACIDLLTTHVTKSVFVKERFEGDDIASQD